MRFLALALAFLAPLTQPSPRRYQVTLADGTRQTAQLLPPTDTTAGRWRLETEDTIATLDPAAPGGVIASVTGKISRWEAHPIKGGYEVQRPIGGALPVASSLLTFHDMRLFLGKRFDAAPGPIRPFVQLGYANQRPGLDRVTLQPGGYEVVTLGNRRLRARRLNYTVTLWLNGKTLRGNLLVGPSGELLRADPPFVSVSLRAASILKKEADGSLTMTYRQPAFTLRAEPMEGGYTIHALVGGKALPGSVTTDGQGAPLRIENNWPGKPFVGRVSEGRLDWSLDAPGVTRRIQPDPDDLVLFPVHLFAPRLWESTLAEPGAHRSGVLLMMQEGLPEEFTLERLADVGQWHRFRLSGAHFRCELLTQNGELIALRSAEGALVIAEGEEEHVRAVPVLEWPSLSPSRP